jgi:hypothetical protein
MSCARAHANQGVAITTGLSSLYCSVRLLNLMGIHLQASALPHPCPGLSGVGEKNSQCFQISGRENAVGTRGGGHGSGLASVRL